MHFTRLGNSGLELSLLGLGTVKFGRNTGVKYPQHFDIPNDKQVLDILACAADCGINLLDTAPAYGNSEERLGKLLKHSPHQWLVSTKVGEVFNAATGESQFDFSAEFIRASIENSLKKLQREVLDVVLIHSNGDDEKIINHYGALDSLNQLKQEGLIRATGMSTKTINGGKLALEQADLAMVTYNLQEHSEKVVIDYAHQLNKGILIKKAFASGHVIDDNKDLVQESFDFILETKRISSIILGSINPIHIQENTQKMLNSMKKNRT